MGSGRSHGRGRAGETSKGQAPQGEAAPFYFGLASLTKDTRAKVPNLPSSSTVRPNAPRGPESQPELSRPHLVGRGVGGGSHQGGKVIIRRCLSSLHSQTHHLSGRRNFIPKNLSVFLFLGSSLNQFDVTFQSLILNTQNQETETEHFMLINKRDIRNFSRFHAEILDNGIKGAPIQDTRGTRSYAAATASGTSHDNTSRPPREPGTVLEGGLRQLTPQEKARLRKQLKDLEDESFLQQFFQEGGREWGSLAAICNMASLPRKGPRLLHPGLGGGSPGGRPPALKQ